MPDEIKIIEPSPEKLKAIDFMESWFCEDIQETEFLRRP